MKSIQRLNSIITILANVTAGAGILLATLYRDPPVIKAAWLGSDIVILIFAHVMWVTSRQASTGSKDPNFSFTFSSQPEDLCLHSSYKRILETLNKAI